MSSVMIPRTKKTLKFYRKFSSAKLTNKFSKKKESYLSLKKISMFKALGIEIGKITFTKINKILRFMLQI